ncbi:probable cytochrome P450 49a1 isoform X2 [Procambarus clarkii]
MSGVLKCGLVRAVGRLPPALSRALAITAIPCQATAAAAAAAAAQKAPVARPVSQVPGPRAYPVIGVLPSVLLDRSFTPKYIHLFMQKMAQKYGPIFQLSLPFNPPMVVVVRPEDAEALIGATMNNPLRQGFGSLQKIKDETADNYFENKNGLLLENGEEWWRVRSRVQSSMMRVKEVLHYLPVMDQISLEFMDRIALHQRQFAEMPNYFQNELYKWALESVGSVALNRRLGCLAPNLAADSEPMKLIKLTNDIFYYLSEVEFNIHFWRLIRTPSYRKLQKAHQEFLEIADKNIRETEAALQAQPASEELDLTLMEALLLKPGLSRKDVVTLILDMLFAGIDTTSHTMTFTLYLLAKHPEVQRRLQEEVDTVLGQHTGPLTYHHLARLSYLKAVIKESMRVIPTTIGMSRNLDNDIVLSGYLIPKGWMVLVNAMLMGWDESLFPRAKEFIPERWLRNRPLGPINPYTVLQFGAGTRMCIGRRIAEQEMYTFLARAMQRFTVDYKHEDLEVVNRVVFAPKKPLRFTFTERN